MKMRTSITELIISLFFLISTANATSIGMLTRNLPYTFVDDSLNQNAMQLSQSSVNTNVTATQVVAANGSFAITTPGTYVLTSDILTSPKASLMPCIFINASDVTLDLSGYTIALSSSSQQRHNAIIEVAPGLSDIVIMNGILSGTNSIQAINGSSSHTQDITYSTTGIRVGFSPGSYSGGNAPTSNVLIDNVLVTNCSIEGINLNTCNNVILNNVRVYNTGGQTITPTAQVAQALVLNGCNDSLIVGSMFGNTTALNNVPATGITALSCNSLSITNALVSNTTGATGSIRGINLVSCTSVIGDSIVVNGCQGSGITNTPTIVGIDITNSAGGSFSHCAANNGFTLNSTASTYGFRLTNGSNNNSFSHCDAKNNFGAGTSTGFNLSTAHFNIFNGCSSNGNGSNATSQSGNSHLTYGFQLGLNTGNGLASDLTLSCSGNIFKNCNANNNIATAGNCAGFDLSAATNSSIQNCEIKSNIATGRCYGITLHHNNIKTCIEYNTIYSNTGVIGQYGFKDFATNSTTLLRGNVAFGHGATYSGGNATLTDSGTMNYMLSFYANTPSKSIQLMIKEGDLTNMNAFEAGTPTWFNFSILH